MSLALSPVIGTICLEPLTGRDECACDDSTLDLVLGSLAHLESLAEEPAESCMRLVASKRVSRLAALGRALGVRANLAQLLHDLHAEFEQVSARLQD